MGTKAVVIGDIRSKQAPEMSLVEDDDMIEHLAADTPDEPLAVGILPRTARGGRIPWACGYGFGTSPHPSASSASAGHESFKSVFTASSVPVDLHLRILRRFTPRSATDLLLSPVSAWGHGGPR